MRVPSAVIGLTNQNIERAVSVLGSGNLATGGSQVIEFANHMADYLYTDRSAMVNSGSPANLILFEARLRTSKGKPRLKLSDGLLVSSIVWPTTIWPLIYQGLVLFLFTSDFKGFDTLKNVLLNSGKPS